jgi:hypothetical protein
MAQDSLEVAETGRAYGHMAVAYYYLRKYDEGAKAAARSVELGAPSMSEQAKYLFNWACLLSLAETKDVDAVIDILVVRSAPSA